MQRLITGAPAAGWWFAASLLLPSTLLGQSGVATVAAEATVFEDMQDANAGGYSNICVGNLGELTTTRRAFARFDLPEIPAGSVVTRAVYDFTQVRVRFMGPGAPKTANLQLRRVEEAWVEGTGVLFAASCGGGEDVAGVDWANAPAVSGVVSASVFLPAIDGTEITIDTGIGEDDDGLIADVQAWADDPGGNFGWEYRVAGEGTLDNARLLTPGSITIHWTTPLEFEDGFEDPP